MVDTKQANDLILPERKELDMVFGFEHMETDQINNKWFKTKFNPNKFMRVISKWQEEVYWNANYMENHDQPRSVSRFGNDKEFHKESAKMLATLNLALKGTPYIFEGEEIGMTNCVFNSMSEFKDVESHNIDALAKKLMFPKKIRFMMISKTSRDNARTPMQWTKVGGFSSAKPWLKMNPNQNEINVDENLNDKNSIYYHYKTLIYMRTQDQVLINGDFKPLFMGNGIFIFSRNHLDTTYITVSNMTKNVRKIPIILEGKILLSNVGRIELNDTKLLPYESILIKRGA